MEQMRFGAVVLAVCLAALIQTSFAATSHTVGGSTGWTIPTSNSLYSSWAASQTFKVGDTLVFNFQTGTHTVAEVSKSAYDKCTITNPISTASTGPASITLSTSGTHYYICTIPGHCSAGQKLAITAAASTAPAAAPATSPAASTLSSSPSPAPSTSPAASPATNPAASPATSPVASPASSPATSPRALSPSSGSAPSTSIATSPEASTVPSAISPSSGNTAPAPSSATIAGAGFLIPVIMVATAFLV